MTLKVPTTIPTTTSTVAAQSRAKIRAAVMKRMSELSPEQRAEEQAKKLRLQTDLNIKVTAPLRITDNTPKAAYELDAQAPKNSLQAIHLRRKGLSRTEATAVALGEMGRPASAPFVFNRWNIG